MENKIIGLGDVMKDLRTVLEAISIEISQSKKVRCNECPYDNEYYCDMHLLDDLHWHIEGLKQQNDRLTKMLTKCRDSKRIYEETIEFISDANKELLGDIKALKEDNKNLRKQIEQMEEYK